MTARVGGRPAGSPPAHTRRPEGAVEIPGNEHSGPGHAGSGYSAGGYAGAGYAAALAEFGRPLALPRSGGWLLERAIGDTGELDAMGPYPLFACADWSRLSSDLDALAGSLVSVTLVTDPFGGWSEAMLRGTFDHVVPFKSHFVVDLAAWTPESATRHHRYYARRALREVRVEVDAEPAARAAEWTELYETLVSRHDITGLRRFSAESFRRQLGLPGAVLLRATRRGALVGAQIWFCPLSGPAMLGRPAAQGVAYSHLAASNDAGYALGAAYALHWAAIEHFRGRARWLDLGAGAGLMDAVGPGAGLVATTAAARKKPDGLTAFKAGWTSETRPVYVCGRILAPERYRALSGSTAVGSGPTPSGSPTAYFPAYRTGEFGQERR
jgi:hypothetical protein